MFTSFFDTAETDLFADWLVDELKRSLPAGFDPRMKNVAERVDKLNDRIAKRTVELARTTTLNFYKKARLAARVREGMTAHGYPDPFVKSFSYDLLTRIQTASSNAKKR